MQEGRSDDFSRGLIGLNIDGLEVGRYIAWLHQACGYRVPLCMSIVSSVIIEEAWTMSEMLCRWIGSSEAFNTDRHVETETVSLHGVD